MPRRNAERSLAEEDNLRRRMAYERERRGWSYDGLAKRMTDAGCPINQSALYKTEKAEPPRRITVAEMVALASVFEIPLEELLLPPEVVGRHELAELFIAWHDARDAEAIAAAQARDAWGRLQEYVQSRADLDADLQMIVGIWMEHDYPNTAQDDEATAYWMWKITGSNTWKKKAFDHIGETTKSGSRHGEHQAKT